LIPFRPPMTSQTVAAKGRVTLTRDLLHHLGIKPGEKIEFRKLPGGELRVRAARPAGRIDAFLGLLAGKSKKVATIEEISEAAACDGSQLGRVSRG
jgi:antitoxin PrlF